MIDLCVEGDKLLEAGTGAVFNKPVKGVKVNKGAYIFPILYHPPTTILDANS